MSQFQYCSKSQAFCLAWLYTIMCINYTSVSLISVYHIIFLWNFYFEIVIAIIFMKLNLFYFMHMCFFCTHVWTLCESFTQCLRMSEEAMNPLVLESQLVKIYNIGAWNKSRSSARTTSPSCWAITPVSFFSYCKENMIPAWLLSELWASMRPKTYLLKMARQGYLGLWP